MSVIGPVPSGSRTPDDAVFEYTDHSGVTVDSTRARFLRPLSSLTFEHAMPGARVRFRTSSRWVTIHLTFNNLIPVQTYRDIITVLVNGVATDYNPTDSRTEFLYPIELEFDRVDYRNIEVIFPFSAGLDFNGIEVEPGSDLRACLPRTPTKLLAIGDSITHGFNGTRSRNGWVYLLAQLLGMQAVNLGFGSASTNTHGTASYAEAIGPDVITILLGYNDHTNFLGETTFKSNYTAMLNNLLDDTEAEIYCITPTWTSASLSPNISSYRTWTGQVVAAIANPRVHLVDGLTLATNSTAAYPDGVHPDDAGNVAIANALAAIIGG